jgi:hypothetical protein
MSKKNKEKKSKRKKQKLDAKWELRSDKRTAAYLARRLEEIQVELSDLVPDVQSLQRYSDVTLMGWLLGFIEAMRKRHQKFAEDGIWDGIC